MTVGQHLAEVLEDDDAVAEQAPALLRVRREHVGCVAVGGVGGGARRDVAARAWVPGWPAVSIMSVSCDRFRWFDGLVRRKLCELSSARAGRVYMEDLKSRLDTCPAVNVKSVSCCTSLLSQRGRGARSVQVRPSRSCARASSGPGHPVGEHRREAGGQGRVDHLVVVVDEGGDASRASCAGRRACSSGPAGSRRAGACAARRQGRPCSSSQCSVTPAASRGGRSARRSRARRARSATSAAPSGSSGSAAGGVEERVPGLAAVQMVQAVPDVGDHPVDVEHGHRHSATSVESRTRALHRSSAILRADLRRRLHGPGPLRHPVPFRRRPVHRGRQRHDDPAGRREHDRGGRPADGRDRGPPRRPHRAAAGHPGAGRRATSSAGSRPATRSSRRR